MYLYIESVQIEGFRLVIFQPDNVWIESKIEISFAHQEKLLVAIDGLLTKDNYQLQDLRGIIVCTGPGSFSALRIGISTANTLAMSLNIPVKSLVYESGIADSDLKTKLIATILGFGSNFDGPVVANYGREPNISQAKQ